jgi:DNA-binding CsgD family transcriptional regulator/PAS domain-containing protein
MPGAQRVIDEIIHLAHHAAGEPGLWDEVMAQLREPLRAPLIALVEHDFIAYQGQISHAAGIDQSFRAIYRTRFAKQNVWLDARRRLEPSHVSTGAELVPNWELVRTDFYRNWLRPLHAFHCLIGTTFRCAEEIRCLIALRPVADPVFDASDKEQLGAILPHLQCACELDAEFMAIRQKSEILAHVVRGLSEAVLVVDGEGHLVFQNRAAVRLLAQRDGLRLVHGTLAAASGEQTRELRQLVAHATACSAEGAHGQEGELAISCPSGAPPLVVRIVPIPHPAIDRTGRRSQVAVVLTRPTELKETVSLCEFYHMTPAEARLTALIVSGHSLHAAATSLSITKNTARTHMKRIYVKTETHRQVDLVRLLANSAMPPH